MDAASMLARECYGAGGVIEPNSPWVSSSGPAAKNSVFVGPAGRRYRSRCPRGRRS